MDRWLDWAARHRAATTGISHAVWSVIQVAPFLLIWLVFVLTLVPGTLAVVSVSAWWGAAFLWGGCGAAAHDHSPAAGLVADACGRHGGTRLACSYRLGADAAGRCRAADGAGADPEEQQRSGCLGA